MYSIHKSNYRTILTVTAAMTTATMHHAMSHTQDNTDGSSGKSDTCI